MRLISGLNKTRNVEPGISMVPQYTKGHLCSIIPQPIRCRGNYLWYIGAPWRFPVPLLVLSSSEISLVLSYSQSCFTESSFGRKTGKLLDIPPIQTN